MTYFITQWCLAILLVFSYAIEGIWCGKEALSVEMVSKMIEELNWIYRLGKFNQNQIRNIRSR